MRPFRVSLTLTVRASFLNGIALDEAQSSKPGHHLGSSRSAHPQQDGKFADGQSTMAGESLKHLLLASKQAQIGELRVQVSAVQPRSLCESPADGAVTRMLSESFKGLMRQVLRASHELENWVHRSSSSEELQSLVTQGQRLAQQSGKHTLVARPHVYSGRSTRKLRRGSAKTGHPKKEKGHPCERPEV